MAVVSRLPRSTPEEQGMTSASILSFLDQVEKNNLELHSLMILRHGKVVSEGWWSPYGPERPHMLFSLSKSFTSTAIGLAVNEGLLSVDDSVISFFPDDVPEEIGKNLSTMRIRHLLSMSTGHKEDTGGPMIESRNGRWARIFLSLPVKDKPGTNFVYNSGATYMLSAIIQKVTGQKLFDYLKPRVFESLGIEDAYWNTCPNSINTGGWGLNIKTEDIAKFGQMYLNKGVYNGRRILSQAWIEEATSKQISNGDGGDNDWAQGYGYQFWRCRHNAYRGDGAFGQYCVVIPEKDEVIAITSSVSDMQIVLNLIWENLLPEMKGGPLTNDSESLTTLCERLETLKLNPVVKSSYSPIIEKITGKRYILEKNDMNFQAISFDFKKDKCNITLKINGVENNWMCGVERWIEDKIDPPDDPFIPKHKMPVAVSGTWTDDRTFTITHRMVETPIYNTISCKFDEEKLQLEFRVNVSFKPIESLIIKGKCDTII